MAPKQQQATFSRYTKADTTTKNRIIAASYGECGTLKTSFWLTAPGPIVVHSFDLGLEGVAGAPILGEHATKEVYVEEYEWNPTDDLNQDQAIELREKFIESFEYSIQHARTVVIDKETALWELFRYAEFGAPNDAPRNYPQLYQRYRRYINMPKATSINFGLIQGMKTPWVEKINKKTGAAGAVKGSDRERKGMDEIDELVHVNIEHVLEDGEFRLRIGKARGPGGHAIQNQTLPYMTFPDLAQLVFPGTEETDWI